MNRALHSQPARILKRAQVSVETPLAPLPTEAGGSADVASTRTRCVTKEARLVPGATGGTTLEVRCSCGEWTRVELATGGMTAGGDR